MTAAFCAAMKNRAFDRAMANIEREHEEVLLEEQRQARRRAIIARIRKACMLLVGAGLVAFAYQHRLELGQKIEQLTSRTPVNPEAQLGGNLKDLQAAAQKRDAV